MKKSIAFAALTLSLSLTVCGCGHGAANAVLTEPKTSADKEYELGASNLCFDFDRNGNLYTMTTKDSGKVKVYPPSKEGETELKIPIYHTILSVTSSEGEEIKQYVFDEDVGGTTLEYADGSVYYTVRTYIDDTEVTALKKYVLGESTAELVCSLDGLETAESAALIDNVLYILGSDPSNASAEPYTNDSYRNSGEVILAYDLLKNETGALFEKGAVKMSETPQDTLMIYAHDGDGYFFTEYDPKSGFSEKKRKNLGMLYSFAVCGEDRYIYSSLDTEAAAASFSEEGKADIDVEYPVYGNIKVSEDGRMCYAYTEASENGFDNYNILLINKDISSALNVNLSDKLTMISAEYVDDAPSSLGFSVVREEVPYDSFALTVLSQDPKYDMYIASSRSSFAESIKSKGSFCPLNVIEGVKEYIDSCLPCLKEAVINENGDIWAIPVALHVPSLAYFEEKSEKIGADISKLSAEEFIELVNAMYEDKEKNDLRGELYPLFYAELLLSNYLFGSTDFDTEEFRAAAETIRNGICASKAFAEESRGAEKLRLKGDYSGVAYTQAYNFYENERLSRLGARAAELPMLTDNPVPATCVFLCVNPSSRNLEKTLEYISALAQSLSEDNESLMREDSPKFSESDYYTELKDVYKRCRVRFSYSNEIILSDFFNYVEGKISLDDFISEANRKLSAYLNE